MGLTLSIYTNPTYAGCAAGGISELVTKVTLVGVWDATDLFNPKHVRMLTPQESGPAEPREEAPAVVLHVRRFGTKTVLSVTPLDAPEHWYTAGGAYVATSDSRFAELTEQYGERLYGALAFHDRMEW